MFKNEKHVSSCEGYIQRGSLTINRLIALEFIIVDRVKTLNNKSLLLE